MNAQEVISRYKRIFAKVKRVNYVPIVAVEGRDAIIRDLNGREFSDFASSAAVMNIGYCNEKVVKAIEAQVRKLNHFTFIYGFNIEALELAEELAKLAL